MTMVETPKDLVKCEAISVSATIRDNVGIHFTYTDANGITIFNHFLCKLKNMSLMCPNNLYHNNCDIYHDENYIKLTLDEVNSVIVELCYSVPKTLSVVAYIVDH